MAEERVQRKLAAILAADVVGYSRLIGAKGEGTIAQQKVHRSELIDQGTTCLIEHTSKRRFWPSR